MLEIASTSLDDTLKIGSRVGRKLKGGEVIELVGDVGAGKTVFVRGLVQGFGSNDVVASPTFTISRVYHGDETDIHHFDFYRLHEPGIIRAELAEVIEDEHVVVAIEWSDIVEDVLPEDRLTVSIQATDENTRSFKFVFGPQHTHLCEGLAEERQ